MPRKSAEALTVVLISGPKRPSPPPTITAAQARTWRAVVDAQPATWFTASSLPLLSAFVRAIDAHEVVSAQVDAFEVEWLRTDEGLARYDRLLSMQERQARIIASLATRMRLTQQSRYDKVVAAADSRRVPSSRKRPWDCGDGARELETK